MTRALRDSFDGVAGTYDEARPEYPAELYDAILAYAELSPSDLVLEVGVGTGKATPPFAERGYQMHGIEPGAKLASVARANLHAFPNVSILTTSFEAWPIRTAAYALAFSAQAYHWLDESGRVEKFADCLVRGGTLAIFGHSPSIATAVLRAELDEAYRQWAPSLATGGSGARAWYASRESPAMRELSVSERFGTPTFQIFSWKRRVSAELYCALLSTYSDHSTLPTNTLQGLLEGVRECAERHGGVVELDYQTGLIMAKAL